MQTLILLKAFGKHYLFALLLVTCFSFSAIAGGKDTYKIYLNNKLLFTEADFQQVPATLKGLNLSTQNHNDELVVYYSHCGTAGKGRRIVLKDDNNKVYGEWKFADNSAGQAMRIPVMEIMEKIKNSKSDNLKLGYSSNEFANYIRVLTPVILHESKLVAQAKLPVKTKR